MKKLLIALLLSASTYAQQPRNVQASTVAATRDHISADLKFGTGRTGSFLAGSTLSIAGTLSGTPTGGTLDLTSLGLTLATTTYGRTIDTHGDDFGSIPLVLKANGVLGMTFAPIGSLMEITAYNLILSGSNLHAALRIPHTLAPASPVNGDLWTTTAGLWAQINGTTVGPFIDATAVPSPPDVITNVSGVTNRVMRTDGTGNEGKDSSVTLDDSGNFTGVGTINGLTLGSGSITSSGYTQNTAKLLGRTTASSGAIEEIGVGTSLSLAAGSLNAIQDIRTSASPNFTGLKIGDATYGMTITSDGAYTAKFSSGASYMPFLFTSPSLGGVVNFYVGGLNLYGEGASAGTEGQNGWTVQQTGQFFWSVDTYIGRNGVDTGLARPAAGVVKATNGSTGFGSFSAASYLIRDTSAAFDVTISATSTTALTAGRALVIDLDNAARNLKFTSNATIGGTHSGTSSGTNTGDQTITLTGDVTGTGTGSFATTLANVPTGTPHAGSSLFTAIAAPSTPAAGKASVYVDSTSKNIAVKDDAGVVKHGVQTVSATASQWIRAIDDAGAGTKSQPAFTDISGSVAAGQMPALTGDITTSAGAVATTLATVASAGTTGSSTAIPVVTINAKGLTTGITTAAVIAPAGTLSGATLNSGVTASSLTSVGTLTGGATGAGFTVALTTSTITGTLPAAQMPALTGDVTTVSGAVAATLANVPVGATYATDLTAQPKNDGGWNVYRVSGSNATNTNQTLATITGLTSGTLSVSTLYEFEASLKVGTTTTAGCKWGVTCAGSGTAATVNAILTVTASSTTGASDAITSIDTANTTAYLTSSGQDGYVLIRGFLTTRGSGTPTLSIQNLKVTSGTATTYIGSVLRVRKA